MGPNIQCSSATRCICHPSKNKSSREDEVWTTTDRWKQWKTGNVTRANVSTSGTPTTPLVILTSDTHSFSFFVSPFFAPLLFPFIFGPCFRVFLCSPSLLLRLRGKERSMRNEMLGKYSAVLKEASTLVEKLPLSKFPIFHRCLSVYDVYVGAPKVHLLIIHEHNIIVPLLTWSGYDPRFPGAYILNINKQFSTLFRRAHDPLSRTMIGNRIHYISNQILYSSNLLSISRYWWK